MSPCHLNSDSQETVSGSHSKLYSSEGLSPRREAGRHRRYFGASPNRNCRFKDATKIIVPRIAHDHRIWCGSSSAGAGDEPQVCAVKFCSHTAQMLPCPRGPLCAPAGARSSTLPGGRQVGARVSSTFERQLRFNIFYTHWSSTLLFTCFPATVWSVLLCQLHCHLGWPRPLPAHPVLCRHPALRPRLPS